MSSISWTLLHVCGGADISRPGQEQEEQVEARTEGWEVERENRNVLLHDEELINVFQPPRVRARSCAPGSGRSCIEHKGISQLVDSTDRELKIRVAECTHRRRGYAVALSLSTSVCPCVHHSVQQPCLLVGEERYRPLKAIYFSDHLPKAKGAGSFDPALDSSR